MKSQANKRDRRQEFRMEFLKRVIAERKHEIPTQHGGIDLGITFEDAKRTIEALAMLSSIQITDDERAKDLDWRWIVFGYDEEEYQQEFTAFDAVDTKENTIVFKVHLDRKREDIIEGMKTLLTYLQGEAKRRRLKFKRLRPRYDEYDIYLKVWDLKKEGKSDAEIVQKVYPLEAVLEGTCHDESAETKVRRAYREAKKMIEGGRWRLI